MKSKERIAIYLRVSSHEQSTEMQRNELMSYADARGWPNLKFYEDKATGAHSDRTMLRKMLHDASSRRIDVILIWKLDRLARSLRDLVNILESLTEVGVTLISLKENIDLGSSAGRLLVHMIGAFAQFERDLIIQRVRSGLNAAKDRGIKLGRPQKVDAQAVRRLRRENLSLSQIARKLGISKSAVHKTLKESPSKNRPSKDLKAFQP